MTMEPPNRTIKESYIFELDLFLSFLETSTFLQLFTNKRIFAMTIIAIIALSASPGQSYACSYHYANCLQPFYHIY